MTATRRVRPWPHRHHRPRRHADAALDEAVIGRVLLDVVHDLTGFLSTLMAAVELARMELPPQHPTAADLAAARASADGINQLRRWLLSYVQRDELPRSLLSLNSLVEADLPMFTRLLSDRVTSHVGIEARLAPDLPLVEADPTRLRRVLLNLVVNARDACDAQERGSIVITTTNRELDGAPHVVLSVRDNGAGMSEETRRRVMVPGGHTTKGHRGHGRGMGMCRRAVEEEGGQLLISSAEGYGTVVTVALRAA